MKYLSIIIVLAMLIFITIDGKKKPKKKTKTTKKPPTTISIGPPKWRYWDGKKPLDARLIAENAAALWYDCGHKYFKFVKLNSTETRTINEIHRYRVRYYAKKCQSGKPEKCCEGKGKKKVFQNWDV
uniref:Uncharacterized protein n=1 Tax=Strongyloides venezuelensis TaxID=75913 RepID=A0A0K0FBL7_STRVS